MLSRFEGALLKKLSLIYLIWHGEYVILSSWCLIITAMPFPAVVIGANSLSLYVDFCAFECSFLASWRFCNLIRNCQANLSASISRRHLLTFLSCVMLKLPTWYFKHLINIYFYYYLDPLIFDVAIVEMFWAQLRALICPMGCCVLFRTPPTGHLCISLLFKTLVPGCVGAMARQAGVCTVASKIVRSQRELVPADHEARKN